LSFFFRPCFFFLPFAPKESAWSPPMNENSPFFFVPQLIFFFFFPSLASKLLETVELHAPNVGNREQADSLPRPPHFFLFSSFLPPIPNWVTDEAGLSAAGCRVSGVMVRPVFLFSFNFPTSFFPFFFRLSRLRRLPSFSPCFRTGLWNVSSFLSLAVSFFSRSPFRTVTLPSWSEHERRGIPPDRLTPLLPSLYKPRASSMSYDPPKNGFVLKKKHISPPLVRPPPCFPPHI